LTRPIKVVQYGVGPIGSAIVTLLSGKQGVKIAGAIDIDKEKVGKDLGDVAGASKPLGICISSNADEVLGKAKAEVVLHSTGSYLNVVSPQILKCVKAGSNVISTCEELTYPFETNQKIALQLDRLAMRYGVTVLGTGVNPGFIMDTLPIALTGACQSVTQVSVTRIVDASRRRLQLQRKIGAGLSPEEFQRLVQERKVRHVGLEESIRMIASALGWKLDRVEETVEPVIAEVDVESPFLKVENGRVAGLKQFGRGVVGNREAITLDLQIYVGAKEPTDSVVIEGVPPIDMTIKGGIHGDLATAAIVVNSIPKVLKAEPGLLTMKDLPVLSAIP
jgi:4-hydroxy-tetrahydrodipicolinate reductase